MKKLMIVAAVAALTAGAFADVCAPVPVTSGGSECLVYDLTFKMKTLGPKKMSCKDSDDVYYLKDASRTLKGYLWFCEDVCWDTDDEPYIVLWDTKSKTAVIPLLRAVEGSNYVPYATTIGFDFLGRYDKKANKVAAFWQVNEGDVEIYAAGVKGKATIDKDDYSATLKSISGNAVGKFSVAEIKVSNHCTETEFTALIADLCECWESWCVSGHDADVVPATGTWSLKYNKKLSTGTKSILSIVPSYAIEVEE